jgi:ABC-type phosphate/phosphonate transport system substrate-binding protein
MTVASLAMYPFPHLRAAYERLWDDVRARLSFGAPKLDWDLDPTVACRRDDLLLGQTCGWPLITELATIVRVVGTFDCDVTDAVDGTYRSLLVTYLDDPLADVLQRPDLRVAANSVDSLSGWISLRSVAAEHHASLDDVEWTGSHAASLAAVLAHRCHLAAIDAVSWVHLGGDGLSIVGQGPRIPCLPLVTSQSSSPEVVEELRGALAAAVSDPAMAGTCSTLKIRRFLRRDLADYQGLSEMAQVW